MLRLADTFAASILALACASTALAPTLPPHNVPAPPNWHGLAYGEYLEVSPLWEPQEALLIHKAAALWNAATGADWQVIPERPWCDVFEERRNYIVPDLMLAPLGLTRCPQSGCLIRMRPMSAMWVTGVTSNQLFRVTVMHELGHALGLDHQPKGLMQSVIDQNTRPCISDYVLFGDATAQKGGNREAKEWCLE